MRREWEPEELIAAWTLLDGDWELVGNKTGATRLGFGLMLKFFEQEGRFPRHAGELPKAAVDYVAGQVKVESALLAEYDWSGRSIERHRAQVRDALGFRESTRADEDVLAEWLADKICPMVFTDEGLRAALLARCRTLKIEPPGRVERIVGAGRARFEREFCLHVLNGLSADSARSLWELATSEDGFLLELKSDPGRLGLETLLEEIVKLRRAKALGLAVDLFGGYSDRLVASWRARAMASHPSDFAANQPPVRLTLVAALAWSRTTEITDALVDLFIGLVSKINTRAERRVERAIEAEARKVHRKTEKLFSIAEASLRAPEGTVRQVVFPAVPGGENTLRALVAEAKADARAYKARVRTVLTSSYTSYYRRMLPKLLAAIEFKCNNTAYRPVMDAVDLLQRYADIPNTTRHYDASENVPIQGVVPDGWLEAVVDDNGIIERASYELCVIVSLKDALRRREIYVAGARRWRNPEEDLPIDFEDNRDVHYETLRQPLDASVFIETLKEAMRAAMAACGQEQVRRHEGEDAPRRAALAHPRPGQAAGSGEPTGAAHRGRRPLGDHRPAGLPEGVGLRHRLHRRVHHGRHQGGDPAGSDPQTAAAGPVRARHERGDQTGRRRRPPRRDRGSAARHQAPVRQPRQPASGDRDPGQRHLEDAGPAVVGQRDRVRVGFEEVRIVVVEHDDRVPRPLRRPRRHDLLARGP